MPWSRAFDDPIPLPRGRQLVTLKDAATYIQRLPKAEQDLEEWQAAVEKLCSWSSSSTADHDGAHWRAEGIESRARSGV